MLKHKFQIFLAFILLLNILFIVSCKKEKEEDTPAEYIQEEIVEAIVPGDGLTEVSVDVHPQIIFARPIDQLVSYNSTFFRPVLDEIYIIQNGTEVNFTEEWNASGDTVTLIPEKILEPAIETTINVITHWEVRDKDYVWVNPGEELIHTYEAAFTMMSVSTTEIEEENVLYAYPVPNQYHYLQDEYNKGFIQLYATQRELFNTESGADFKMRLDSKEGYLFETDVTYDGDKGLIEYSMPTDLDNEEIYKLEILKINNDKESVLYAYYFRTSKFDSFSGKLGDFSYSSLLRYYIAPAEHQLIGYYELPEYFDEFELIPFKGLIQFELETKTLYYEKFLYPVLYEHIDLLDEVDFRWSSLLSDGEKDLIVDSEEREAYNIDLDEYLGIPPLDCFNMYQDTEKISLTEENISDNDAPAIQCALFYIYCNLVVLANNDYYAAKSWLATEYYGNSENVPDWADELYHGSFTTFTKGDYYFTMKYILPDGTITSEKEVKWTLEIGDEI